MLRRAFTAKGSPASSSFCGNNHVVASFLRFGPERERTFGPIDRSWGAMPPPPRKAHFRREKYPSSKKMKTFEISNDPDLRFYSRRRLLAMLCPLILLLVIGYSAFRGFSFFLVKSSDVVDQSDQDRNAKTQESPTTENDYGIYTYEIVNEFHHDPKAFTQGFLFAGNDTFYESTGMYGASSVRKVQVQTGKVKQLYQMDRKYFGEGLTLMNGRLFQVAWRITSGFIYDAVSLTELGTFKHPMKDGWGLATDGAVLYGSDGTSTIYVIQPHNFAEQRRFVVKDQEKEIHDLNELEYVNNELWANVWMKNCIVRISPKNGQVLGWILLQNLRSNLLRQGYKGIDVLNGIAWDGYNNRIYVTGKYWPKVYEIKVYPHSEKFKDRELVWSRCKV